MAAGVPKQKGGESLAAYHGRLSDLIRGAEEAGDRELSIALQRRAGKIARDHRDVAEKCCPGQRSGPGTYPWKECVSDQRGRGYDDEHANAICGRIRANSRRRYPEYWAVREGYSSAEKRPQEAQARAKERAAKRARNPGQEGDVSTAASLAMRSRSGATASFLGRNPASDSVPFCALGLDGGPRSEGSRDNVVVVDKSGKVLDVREIHGTRDLVSFEADYPGLPVFGPLHVLASDVRDLRREVEAPRIERRAR